MEWIFALILAPAAYSIANHIDGHLLNKQEAGVKSLIVFSALIGIIVAVVLWPFLGNEIFSVSTKTIIVFLIIGIIELISIVLYLYALDQEEVGIAAPMMQLISVLGLGFGYFLFGEVPTSFQLIGALLIIAGGVFLNITEGDGEEDGEEKRIVFNKRVFILMLLCSFFFALAGVMFKFVTIEPQFWVATFWQHVAIGVPGILLLAVPGFRKDFFNVFKKNTKAILGYSAVNEVVTVLGNMMLYFAILIAPISMVYLGESTQPVFILLFGILIAKFFPEYTNEKIDRKSLVKKIIAIAVMVVGGYLIVLFGS